ncbi:MAG TPA: molybdenum cofactor biosynthesis protein MoaE [Candidatus Angelobacter sp.]|nr:molybdenum cofactor biosynthesis protein MoaE [Candidatus Angelobacter sp.]
MWIQVLLFGQLADIIGTREEKLELQPGTRLSVLIDRYGERFPRFRALSGSLACSVNQEYAPASTILQEGDEIAFLPPVSGGKDGEATAADVPKELVSEHCQIVREPIPAAQTTEQIKSPADGAVAIFEGIVRNHTRNRRTLYLDYEAYEQMALREMEKLAQTALQTFRVRDIRILHRLGRLEIGETSVLIAVASAHRGAAFDACRWLIDTLKKTVPIWKKEYFEDGAVWADGEPFPEDIRAQSNVGPISASKDSRVPDEKK